jgi:uncharacterized protein (TIGR03437 family)
MRVAFFVLVVVVVGLICEVDPQAQFVPNPDAPPRLSLIRVSTPTPEGEVTVTGAPGAVSAGNLIVLVTLDTGHFVTTRSAADGSFSKSIFAPAGTSIMIKDDTRGQGFFNESDTEFKPGTILRVPDSTASEPGLAFTVAGLTGQTFNNSMNVSPPWNFQGTISSREFEPGGTFSLTGKLRIISPALRTAGVMRVRLLLNVERLAGPDGTGSSFYNFFYSSLLTPTHLPIERRDLLNVNDPSDVWVYQRLELTKTQADRAETNVELSYRLPAELPAGFYRPFIEFYFEGVPTESIGDRLFAGTGFNLGRMYFPHIRVGNPAPPRLFATLLTDTLSNGTRGVCAVEDRHRFGVASQVVTQSEKFIIPRSHPTTGTTYSYRLEPFVLAVSAADRGQPPSAPRIPFRFPSGQLTVRVQKPDGSTVTIGPAPFAQPRMRGLFDRAGAEVRSLGGHLTNPYQLSTMDPRFEVQFTQDGLHVIRLEGSIEDIWGTRWSVGGTYEIYVARALSLDTAVLPGTPFEVGDVLNPGLTLTPPLPASVEVQFQLAPNSDGARTLERVATGRANRFGYFHPPGGGIALDQPGEYRLDVTAAFRDAQGNLWMGTRTWGGVVAPRNSSIIAHGRRGIDGQPDTGRAQWYFRTQTSLLPGSGHVQFAFHSGDVMWLQKSDIAIPNVTFQDPTGSLVNLLRGRDPYPSSFDQRATVGEAPLFSSRPDRFDPHIDPAKVDLWGYKYSSVQRPLVRVREQIGEDITPAPYWAFTERYAAQLGTGRDGDLPNDIKFQYAAAVLRGAALPGPQYGIYGSLFVLVPDTDPGGGTRVFPPFQGNGGGPSGGPSMKLKGQDIDLFIHLTGIRPGSVLEVGDTFSIVGAVGPPLPALVSTKVTTPGGRAMQFSGRANRVGYYYRPQDDFAVSEPGIYTVDARVTFDGQTSAGQVSAPFPTGDVLGSAQGRFFVYVVPRDSPLLTVNLPETMTVATPGQLDITARAAGQNLTSGHMTTIMPGFLLQTNQLGAAAGALAYRYDPATLARDFPNLDLNPPADVITLSLFGQTSSASYAARVLVLHGQEFFNLTPSRAPARAVASVSAASFSGTTLASESIVAAFGTNLAINTQAAATLPLPTSLAGTTISVKDSAGAERLAPLFFVSSGQINYQMPPGTAPGAATVTITNSYGEVSAGTVQIAPVAPGLFAVNANGQGVAAALALRVKADGTQQFEPVSRFDPAQNRFVSVPLDLGPETEQVFLILFGTGLRFRNSLSTVSARLGGVEAPVLFAGAQGALAGLDQTNLLLSRSLIGRGEVDVVFTVDGKTANAVRIAIR